MGSFNYFDLGLVVLYIVGVTAWGSLLGRKQRDARDYFLADRSVPWWVVCFSLVATETSVLTFISVPATAYTSDLWMLQLTFGYLLGRIAIALFLLPAYFRGEIATAYELLQQRFGLNARRFASITFLVTRFLASSVRLFATAIPIKIITGLPYTWAILITGGVTLIYTYYGGLKAVVWVDVLQMFVFLFGAFAALFVLIKLVPGGWSGIVAAAAPAHKLSILHMTGGFGDTKWILTGFLGGAFLSMASQGTEQLFVQRQLAAPSLRDAQKAIIASGVWVIAQFALFLVVGVGLFAYYHGRAFDPPDEVLPAFLRSGLPMGIGGIIIAGIFSVAMSSEASAINSLASSLTHDIYAPFARDRDDHHLMRVGKVFTLVSGLVLIVGAVIFQFFEKGTPVVVIALQIASFTYGGLLGGFLLALISRRAQQFELILGMSVAMGTMTLWWVLEQFWAGFPAPLRIDPLWFSLVGSIITVGVGMISARLRGNAVAAGI
jgi:SSS family solute:Na+ symporter